MSIFFSVAGAITVGWRAFEGVGRELTGNIVATAGLVAWFLLLAGLFRGLAEAALQRARMELGHQCPFCGYDLRSTASPGGPIFRQCPECGATLLDE